MSPPELFSVYNVPPMISIFFPPLPIFTPFPHSSSPHEETRYTSRLPHPPAQAQKTSKGWQRNRGMARIRRKDICTRYTAISSFRPSSFHFPSGLKEYWNSPYATYSQSRGRSRWRNQFLVDYLQSKEISRSKKQVASHIQVLRNMWKGEPGLYVHLIAVARPSYHSLQNIISSLERTKPLQTRHHLLPLSSKIIGMNHPLYPLTTTMTIRLRILFRPTIHHLTLNLISLSRQSTTQT